MTENWNQILKDFVTQFLADTGILSLAPSDNYHDCLCKVFHRKTWKIRNP